MMEKKTNQADNNLIIIQKQIIFRVIKKLLDSIVRVLSWN